MKFTATYIEPSTNPHTATVIFADPEQDPDMPPYFSVQRTIEFPDSMYYFEINDQSNSSYQGLERIVLSSNQLLATLPSDTVTKFGDDDFQHIEIDFDLDEETFETVKTTLMQIFEGFSEFQIG